MTATLIVSLDQGSSSTKVLVVDTENDQVVGRGSAPARSTYPKPGWVEQDGLEISAGVRHALQEAMAGIDPARVLGVTISNQRESMLAWDADTGHPASPLITWQDQRTADACAVLTRDGHAETVLKVTGLPLDPMFSGTRATWLLDQLDPTRTRARAGKLRLGTVDSWLLHEFTGAHLIEAGNASRTQLLNLDQVRWDEQMLQLFDVPEPALPEVSASTGPFPALRNLPPLLDGTPVLAVLADSHAALFAHGAWTPGPVKATYGTGSSVMTVTGTEPGPDGLCRTIAWQTDQTTYALEGNIRSAGSTLAWLAGVVGTTPGQLADLAETVPDTGDVDIVPAFGGLAAPWWDAEATGIITGVTLGTTRAHLARAALESIVHQVEDVVAVATASTAAAEAQAPILADGGIAANQFVMQLQADVSGRPVSVSQQAELSPLGAAHLGQTTAGTHSLKAIAALHRPQATFQPNLDPSSRRLQRERWSAAVHQARRTASEQDSI